MIAVDAKAPTTRRPRVGTDATAHGVRRPDASADAEQLSPPRSNMQTGAGDGPSCIVRTRLLRRLGTPAVGMATVVSAPAGYGKSVLIDQWVRAHLDVPVVAVRFRADDDAHRAAVRIIAALTPVFAEPLSRAAYGAMDIGPKFRAALERDLASIPQCVVVLDGTDLPDDTGLVAVLGLLADRLQRLVPVIVGRRSMSDDAVLIDASELAFNGGEARSLVHQVSGRDLRDEQLENLLARTEGWPVGLQLAAIGLRGTRDVDAFIDAFAGTDRYVSAYFCEEVLHRESPAVRRFLSQMSVLETLHGPLADAITGQAEGAGMLTALERGGLFTRRSGMSDGNHEYVYQRLFRDVMRRELRLAEPGAERDLLALAGGWHRAQQEPEAAARYLIEAEEWGQLIELVDAVAKPLFERGSARDALRWLALVPSGSHADDGRLALRRAYLLTMLGESAHAAQIVHDLDSHDASPGEKASIAALRASWAFLDAPPDAAIRAADTALQALTDVPPAEIPDIFGMTSPANLRAIAGFSRARALWYQGDTEASRVELLAVTKQPGIYAPWTLFALSSLAILEAWDGNFRVARMHIFRACHVATRAGLLDHASMIDTRIAAAHISRERGDLEHAAESLAEARKLAGETRRPITQLLITIEQGWLHLAAGQPELGLEAIERHRAADEAPRLPAVEARLRALNVRLALAQGEAGRAQLIVDTSPSLVASELKAAAMQTAIARHDMALATVVLDAWPSHGPSTRDRLLHDLWAAVVAHETGNTRQAVHDGSAVLSAAAVENNVRLFLDAGRAAVRLLRAVNNVAPTPYTIRLLRDAEDVPAADIGAPYGLSKRELDVIRYLPTHLSNAQIASRLYVSVNTLKTHLRTIYRKLGVTSRREAIRTAERLGIA